MEMSAVGQVVAVAAVSADLGLPPDTDPVQAVMAKVGTPEFTARFHRIWREILSSTTATRRRRLAAVLIGGPFAIPDRDKLDRIDTLVTRFLDADITLLDRISAARRAAPPHRTQDEDSELLYFENNGEGQVCEDPRQPQAKERLRNGGTFEVLMKVDLASIHSLDAAGCIRFGRVFQHASVGDVYCRSVAPTHLGELLLEGLRREPIASAVKEPGLVG
jgi:hypothetical protein